MIKYTDIEVMDFLQSADEQSVNRALKYLYQQVQPSVSGFIRKNKGNEQDVDDIFHDGLIAFYKMVRQNKLSREGMRVEAYLYSICRNMWAKKLKKAPQELELTESFHNIPVEEIPLAQLQSSEQTELIEALLQKLGEDCHRILKYYYFDQLRMKEIVKSMALSSEQVAKNKKSACMKKLRSLVLNSVYYKNLFK